MTFNPILITKLRNYIPSLIAQELVKVQPMSPILIPKIMSSIGVIDLYAYYSNDIITYCNCNNVSLQIILDENDILLYNDSNTIRISMSEWFKVTDENDINLKIKLG